MIQFDVLFNFVDVEEGKEHIDINRHSQIKNATNGGGDMHELSNCMGTKLMCKACDVYNLQRQNEANYQLLILITKV